MPTKGAIESRIRWMELPQHICPARVQGEQVLNRLCVVPHLNPITIDFGLSGAEKIQLATLAIHVAPLDASVGRLQGRNVFAAAPVLPIDAAPEFFRAVMDRHAQAELAIHDADNRS